MGMNLMMLSKDPQEGEKKRFRREGRPVGKDREGRETAAITMNSPMSSVPVERKAI